MIRYFILCRNCNNKIYLLLKGKKYKTKKEIEYEIRREFTLRCKRCKKEYKYHVNDVICSTCANSFACSVSRTIVYMTGGWFLGTLACVPFIGHVMNEDIYIVFSLVGMLLGLLISIIRDNKEYELVNEFNKSFV